jgi:Putative methyltransferase
VSPDWRAWHDAYDDPESALARRLRVIQARVAAWLDAAPPGPLRVISMCAGQGRDLIGVLTTHPRRHDVAARLVELDPRNVAAARLSVAGTGLRDVSVVEGDAGVTDAYAGMAPADLVLACGIFGNITEAAIERTIGFCTQLCATGGAVVWTRRRSPPDLVPQRCRWFAQRDFEQVWVSAPDQPFGVGVHRFTGHPPPLARATRMFTFVETTSTAPEGSGGYGSGSGEG